MEYLTLQDIPHRHCDPLHSRRMTSSQTSLGNMAAAVSEVNGAPSSFVSPSPSGPTPLHPPIQRSSYASYRFGSHEQPCWRARTSSQIERAPPLHHVQVLPVTAGDEEQISMARGRSFSPLYLVRSHALRRSASPELSRRPINPSYHSSLRRPSPATMRGLPYQDTHSYHQDLTVNREAPYQISESNTLTDEQNHHMRSSPPIQPGEQNFPGKLPSFSEVSSFPLTLSNLLISKVSPYHKSKHTTADTLPSKWLSYKLPANEATF